MPDGDAFTIKTNIPDFKRQLTNFKTKLEKTIVAGATAKGAQVFKKYIRKEAPVAKAGTTHKGQAPPGTLKASIYTYRHRNPQSGTIEYSISFRKGKDQQRVSVRRAIGKRVKGQKRQIGRVVINRDAFYGRFLELGWFPRKPGQALGRPQGARGSHFRKLGVRRRAEERARNAAAGARFIRIPFIEPGFNKATNEVLNVFELEMQKRIDQANAFVGPTRP